jgi:hypothetical protein
MSDLTAGSVITKRLKNVEPSAEPRQPAVASEVVLRKEERVSNPGVVGSECGFCGYAPSPWAISHYAHQDLDKPELEWRPSVSVVVSKTEFKSVQSLEGPKLVPRKFMVQDEPPKGFKPECYSCYEKRFKVLHPNG